MPSHSAACMWETGMLDGPRFIINFPTKGALACPVAPLTTSKTGLTDLVRCNPRPRNHVDSGTAPGLRQRRPGLGRCASSDRRYVRRSAEVEVRLYPPADAPAATEMRNATKAPNMTVGRCGTVTLLDGYSRVALDASLIGSRN